MFTQRVPDKRVVGDFTSPLPRYLCYNSGPISYNLCLGYYFYTQVDLVILYSLSFYILPFQIRTSLKTFKRSNESI